MGEEKMQIKNRVVFIYGEKIDLVVLDKNRHFEFCIAVINDPKINIYLTRGFFPVSAPQEEEWFEKKSKNASNIVLAIETKSGEICGTIGLHKINWENRNAEFGILIAPPSNWGKGIGTEAEKLIISHGFNIGLKKITGLVFKNNIASRKVMEKNGLQQEGLLRSHFFKNGEWHDVYVYSVLNTEWKTN